MLCALGVRQASEEATLNSQLSTWTCDGLSQALGYSKKQDLSRVLDAVDERGYRLSARRKSGKRKRRVVSEPREELKAVQKRLLGILQSHVPLSASVFSRKRQGVVKNAAQHLRMAHMCILDISGCYPSTSVRMVRAAFARMGLSEEVSQFLTRLTTLRGFVPQGAPTSQFVVDIVFRNIDAALLGIAVKYGARYTRYGDDLTFSGSYPLEGLDGEVIKVLSAAGYQVNLRKRRLWGSDDLHVVTGVVVGDALRPQGSVLRRIGQQLRRRMWSQFRLEVDEVQGLIGWVGQVDRKLGEGLRKRFRKVRGLSASRRSKRPIAKRRAR